MFDRVNNHIFSILILLIFTSASAYGISCTYSETSCSSGLVAWCCPNNEYCGADFYSCKRYNDSPGFTLGAIIVIVIFVSLFLILCVFACVCIQRERQGRLRSSIASANNQSVTYSMQQQSTQRPIRVVHVRPDHNVGTAPSVHSIYEASPPSYEAAVANYQSTSLPPMTAAV